ncbi:hypothetical protein [Hymenobacter lapidiphilus]|uniref:hypothetical protein n=1 Tax=Hymenobacter sp. CCM 8763 TaxID=2303334 RepID=UPI0011C0E15B|nr:hypothetical protein [Hymenobacter sp. CCM 8763]
MPIGSSNAQCISDDACCVVQKIKFMNNKDFPEGSGVYILYVRTRNNKYRIVSTVANENEEKCIQVGVCYSFAVKDYFYQDSKSPVDFELAQSDGAVINGNYIKRNEGDYKSLFYDENLEGLCFRQQ